MEGVGRIQLASSPWHQLGSKQGHLAEIVWTYFLYVKIYSTLLHNPIVISMFSIISQNMCVTCPFYILNPFLVDIILRGL